MQEPKSQETPCEEQAENVPSTESKKQFSRRGFLKAAATSAAVAGGTGLIGSLPLAAESKASVAGSEPEGARPIPPVHAPAKWDDEADVVVVGTGGGGLAAALKAAENGKKVIVIEKLSEESVGGTTKQAIVFITYGGSRLQNEAKFAVPGFPFNATKAVQEMYPYFQYSADISMLEAVYGAMGPCVDWMEQLGVPWELDPYTGPMCHVWKGIDKEGFIARGIKPVTDLMYRVAKEKGVKFYLETAAVALVSEGGRIVGLKTRSLTTGKTRYLKGATGVVLAAGGFANNRDMLKKYLPAVYEGAGCTYAMPCDTGECIRMGVGAGADIAGLGSSTSFDAGIDWFSDGKGTFHQYLYNGSTQLARQPWLGIDINGNRYPYLDVYPAKQHNPWDLMPNQAAVHMSLPGHRGYVIFDKHYEENIAKFKQWGCRRPIQPNWPDIDRMPEWTAAHDWREGAKYAIEKGAIKRSNTLEGLGEMLGFKPGVIGKSVASWNEVCASGEDKQFYFPKDWLVPVLEPPFHGIRIGGNVFATKCGLRVTPKMQVVDTNQKVIPGLYAAFHTAGGNVGESALSSEPNCVGMTFTSGFIAGQAVCEEKA